MKIYDCFLFFNELELLDIRLNILDPIVDVFVILESNRTFSGIQKNYLFEKNSNNFARFFPKIQYFKIEDDAPPDNGGISRPWVREYTHRNALYDIFLQISKPDDIFFCSDLDMVPNPSAVLGCLPLVEQDYYLTFELFDFCYYLNTTWEREPFFLGSVIGKIQDRNGQKIEYGQPNNGFQAIMEDRAMFLRLPKAGWHYSYLGDTNQISEKISAFSHTEINFPEINNVKNIETKRKQLIPINTSGKTTTLVPIELNNINCSSYVLSNLSKFSHLICKK